MARKFQLNKTLALLITLLICVMAFISLFTPVFTVTSGVFNTEHRQVRISGVDVIHALFSSEDAEQYETIIRERDNTGYLTALSMKNNDKSATFFYIISISYCAFLVVCVGLFVLAIILATFYHSMPIVSFMYKVGHYKTFALLLVNLIFMVVTAVVLTYTTTTFGIITFKTTCYLGFNFYMLIIATLASAAIPVFARKIKA